MSTVMSYTQILTYGVSSVKASRKVMSQPIRSPWRRRKYLRLRRDSPLYTGEDKKRIPRWRCTHNARCRVAHRRGEGNYLADYDGCGEGGGGGGLTTCQDCQEQQQGHAPRIAHLSGTQFGLTTVSDGEVDDWRAL